MKQLDLSQIPFATAEIAESWKRDCEKGVLKGHQRRKHSLPMRYLVWIEINEYPGISWRQLNQVFTKHSLSIALLWLIKSGLIKKIEETSYKGRDRKPTQYFVLCRPFVTHAGYYIGKTPIFGTLSARHGKWVHDIVIKDPNSQGSDFWKKVAKRQVTRFIRRFSKEKEWIDRRCTDDEPFAAAVRLAERKRKTTSIETTLEKGA